MAGPEKRPAPPTPPDETFEPWEEHRGVPLPVLWVAVALAVWGAFMLATTSHVSLKDQTPLATLPAGAVPPADGAKLFAANCVTCHQADGEGIRGAVPPLKGSEIVATGPATVAQILLRGIDGPIEVAGATYDGHMPAFASALTDPEIAALASHVAKTFGGAKEALAAGEVATLRAQVTDQGSFDGGAGIAASVPGLPAQPPAPPQPAQHQAAEAITALVFNGRGDVWACASCHGQLGQGTQTIPRLAGLPAAYIAKQLKDFHDGTRSDGSMRVVASGLSEEDRVGLGAYYAALRVPSTARPDLGGDLARGAVLAQRGDWAIGVPACFSCHGSSGFGVAPGFPGLAAQQAPYIASQIDAWTGGDRKNSPLGLMQKISAALSTADRRAVADYLASLPPVPAQNAAGLAQEASQ